MLQDGDLARAASSVGIRFFHDRYWHPESYWQLQDEYWRKVPVGEVLVHPLILESNIEAEQP